LVLEAAAQFFGFFSDDGAGEVRIAGKQGSRLLQTGLGLFDLLVESAHHSSDDFPSVRWAAA
jgi:hypothetical protein